jgi:hypothetical protein
VPSPHRPPHAELTFPEVDVTPLQRRDLASSKSRLPAQEHDEVGLRASFARRFEQPSSGQPDDDSMASDPWGSEAPLLAGLAAASVRGVTTLGPRPGRGPARMGNIAAAAQNDALVSGSCAARANGFTLDAGLAVPAGQRERLERILPLRPPPPGGDRAPTSDRGRARAPLAAAPVARWHDGLAFTPLELLERLAVLVPRPRINLILYFGVLGARATARAEMAGPGWTAAGEERTFGLDALACPRCGGRLRLIALIEQPAVIKRVFGHLGLPTELPVPRPARPPPEHAWFDQSTTECEADVFMPAS